MTAAPGPQQPDEVRPVWPDDREWVPDDEVTCMYCQRYKNRKVCRCGDPNPPVRPAAPSAQPDELQQHVDQMESELLAARSLRKLDALGHAPYVEVSAQPVRDTPTEPGADVGARDPHWIKDHFELDGDDEPSGGRDEAREAVARWLEANTSHKDGDVWPRWATLLGCADAVLALPELAALLRDGTGT